MKRVNRVKWIASFDMEILLSSILLIGMLTSLSLLIGGFVFRYSLFIPIGLGVLLATPYIRVIASLFYFAFIDRSFLHAFLVALVWLMLSYGLFLRGK